MTLRSVIGGLGLLLVAWTAAPRWQVRELGHSPQTAWTAPDTLEVRDADTLKAAWLKLYPEYRTRPAVPVVDFARWRVVIVALGTRSSGGFQARLDTASVVRDTAMIRIAAIAPPKGCAVTMELTAPAVAIAVPLEPEALRVVVQERANPVRCH